MSRRKFDVHTLTRLAILIAIVLAMKLTGLSSIPVGPLNMTLNMIPIGIGAMLLGPLAGGILGMVYGFTSFYDAVTGGSVMTHIFFQLTPLGTFGLCVVVRILVGVLTGLIFEALQKIDQHNTLCFFAGGLAAPLLNTLLFMGYIVLFFYNSEYIQNRVSTLGATSAFMFVILSVGIQGIVEALTGMIVGGGVAKSVDHALHRK